MGDLLLLSKYNRSWFTDFKIPKPKIGRTERVYFEYVISTPRDNRIKRKSNLEHIEN